MHLQSFTNTHRIRTRLKHLRADYVLFIAMVFIFLGYFTVSEGSSSTQSAQYKEYEVKAAFMYNFLKFIDWPEEKMAKGGNQIIIGIIGEDPFGSATDVLKDKKVEDRDVVIKRFEGLQQLKEQAEKGKKEQLEALKTCHLLFICPSEKKITAEIIDIVKSDGVLTVGDTGGFIESGGAIGFFMEDNKIRFNVNLTSSDKAGLKIRSQLLRLAKKVIKNGSEVSAVDNTTRQEGN
jgi:hypothetical protein